MKRPIRKLLSALLAITAVTGSSFAVSSAVPNPDSCTYEMNPGDANGNGVVNIDDAIMTLKYIAGWKDAKKKIHPDEADVDRDGKITVSDTIKLLKYIAGWSGIRLCHNDDVEVLSEASADEYGRMRLTCKKCGDSEEVLSPKTSKTSEFNIKGVPLTEYTIVFGTCPGGKLQPIAVEMSDTLYRITGKKLSVASADTKYEHEILIGSADRDGVPALDPKSPRAGMTEDGTLYILAYNASMARYFIDEFIQHMFGGNFSATLGRDMLRNPWGEECTEYESVIEPLDIDSAGYSLKFEDEFEGDSLDYDVWMDRAPGLRRDGWNDPSVVRVEDGNLVIGTGYKQHPDGKKYWAGAAIALNEWYSRGYYEIKAKCVDPSYGYWSAFWFQGRDPYIPDRSQGGIGPGGAELDILENNCETGKVNHNIYCAGVDGMYVDPAEKIQYTAYNSGQYYIGDVVNEYHTYSLLWDEDWYTFYVDGIPVGRSNYGNGTSSSLEQLILSVEIGVSMPKPDDEDFEELTQKTNEYYVDYIRIWQK